MTPTQTAALQRFRAALPTTIHDRDDLASIVFAGVAWTDDERRELEAALRENLVRCFGRPYRDRQRKLLYPELGLKRHIDGLLVSSKFPRSVARAKHRYYYEGWRAHGSFTTRRSHDWTQYGIKPRKRRP